MTVDTKFDYAIRRLEPGDVISNIPKAPGDAFMTLLHRDGEKFFFSIIMSEDNCAPMPGGPFTWDGTVMRDAANQPWEFFSSDWIIEKGNALLAARAYQDLLKHMLPEESSEEARAACEKVYPMEILQTRGLMLDSSLGFYETFRRILKIMEHMDEGARPILLLEMLGVLWFMDQQSIGPQGVLYIVSPHQSGASSPTEDAVRELQRRGGKLDA